MSSAEIEHKDNQFSRVAPEMTGEIQATTLSFGNMHHYGSLYARYLNARREVFIDAKGWDLPETEGMEFDQYDTPQSRWVVVHEYGRVLAGMRLTPTTAKCGQYSYMLRDAQRGLLEDIPRDILFFKAPVRQDIWEATRLFVSASVSSKRRLIVQTILLEHMAASARELGARAIIGIVPAVFSRWMKRIGMNATPVGAPMTIDGDRIQAALMNVVNPKEVADSMLEEDSLPYSL
ncbi:N-acyl-L-homoserine lactone synthetase [Roseovarius spongiae]|uniref:Acyl-homoserine-lactone synthase n=2 Tax=Roseovarius spongiae TaxID=2320272 RepID=A0A3A8B903_9RHOB|nr:N-acyl-L-homoserine lactone synthetase [Roseovarius spongiae]